MIPNRKITQIIPAEGWLAVYDLGSGDVADVRTRPLVCWALVEDLGETKIIGVNAEQAAGHADSGTFLGFARVGESLSRFRRE
ncbi:MAG: hypothetical protein AB7G11_11285 [Phycisphaerales bacterium]